MFGQFHGLPVHALVLHAVVLLAPLAAVLGVAFAVPRWRRTVRWPLLVVAAAAAGTAYVAKESGEVLKTALGDQLTGPGNPTTALVERHERLGGRLVIALAVLLVLALIAMLPRMTGGLLGWLLAAGLVVIGVGVLVLTFQTGEAGAQARWNPDGSFDYSGT
jgi:hypothetical protein